MSHSEQMSQLHMDLNCESAEELCQHLLTTCSKITLQGTKARMSKTIRKHFCEEREMNEVTYRN